MAAVETYVSSQTMGSGSSLDLLGTHVRLDTGVRWKTAHPASEGPNSYLGDSFYRYGSDLQVALLGVSYRFAV